jgi:hypothetical protein
MTLYRCFFMCKRELMSVFFTGCKEDAGSKKQNMNGYKTKRAALKTSSAVKKKPKKNCYSPNMFNTEKVILKMMHVIENIRINHSEMFFFIFTLSFACIVSIWNSKVLFYQISFSIMLPIVINSHGAAIFFNISFYVICSFTL